MTFRRFAQLISAVFITLACLMPAADAAMLYWDGTPSTPNGASDGGAGTWDLSGANWDTGGSYVSWTNANNDTAVFGGTTGTVSLGAAITVGGIQFATAGYIVSGDTITLASGTAMNAGTDSTITSILAGSDGFTKTGAGQLTLSASSSSLSGDISINAGQLYATFASLGSGNIVFTGNSDFTKVYNTPGSTAKSFTINDGVSASVGGGTFYYNFATTGVLAGNESAKFAMNMGGNTQKDFNSTTNTFVGELTVSGGGPGSESNENGGRACFKSLADSSQKLRLGNGHLRLNNGGVSMNFVNRQLEILDNARIDNDSTSASVTMTFARDVVATIGNNSKTIYLSGVNTGDNTISGTISDSTNGTGKISLTKWEAGRWILAGTNTYTGTTTVSSGTLVLAGEGSIPDANTVNVVNGKIEVEKREIVGVLQTNGVAVAIGTYGTTSSAAENKLDAYFTGTGILFVGVPFPPSGTVLSIR